jgi:hypothetical protein
MGCNTRGTETDVQRLFVRSGDYGIPTFGTIVSIDIIRSADGYSRYDVSLAELTTALVFDPDPEALNRWVSFASEISRATAQEFEEYVRDQLCVYQVNGGHPEITAAIRDEILNPLSDDDYDPVAEERAFKRLDAALAAGEISENEADSALDRFLKEELSGEIEDNGESLNISVFSQCLVGVSPGSRVGIIKLLDRIAIIPNREAAIFSMHQYAS